MVDTPVMIAGSGADSWTMEFSQILALSAGNAVTVHAREDAGVNNVYVLGNSFFQIQKIS